MRSANTHRTTKYATGVLDCEVVRVSVLSRQEVISSQLIYYLLYYWD